MDWNKTCFLSNFVIGYLNCIPVKLLFRYQVIKSNSVFCFHHGSGPPARQLCKVVIFMPSLTYDSVRWFGPPVVLLGVMDGITNVLSYFNL